MKKRTAWILGAAIGAGAIMLGACTRMGNNDTRIRSEDAKTLRVAMECGYAPYNWTQPDGSNGAVPISGSQDYAYGYDVMMAKKIADRLGYDLEIVKLDWDSLVPAVQAGTIDCVIAGQSITSDRMQMVDFTIPYYYASVVSLVDSKGSYANATSVADLAGARGTSQINTIWYDLALPQIPNVRILPAQESAPAALVSLSTGKADVVVTDMPTAMSAVKTYPQLTLLDFTGTDGDFEVSDEEVNIGISVQKENSELKNAINSVLETMTAEDFDRMMNEAIEAQPENMPDGFMARISHILSKYGGSYVRGAWVTMVIAIVGTLIGCVIGFIVGMIQTIPVYKKDSLLKKVGLKMVKLVMDAYVEVFRGTPMMAQAMFIYFGSSALFGIDMSMWFAAFFIVSINTGAYMAETVRGGILSIDAGQTEGAKAIGMNHVQTMTYIILPQALRNIMPQIGNNLIINIKDTCVLSIIGVVELFYTTKGVAGAYYTYFESFAIAMVMYFTLTFACSRLLRLWESKMDGPQSYDLATTDTLAYTSGMSRFPEPKKGEDE